MKVSIITVCLNSAETIRDTIHSVLQQDYPSIEYIVVDGASRDGTMDIVREYSSHIASIISEPDRGLYDAMNKGIRAATGEVVGFLNSDDIYAGRESVRRLIQTMEAYRVDSVFADLVMVDRKNIDRIVRYYDSSKFSVGRLRYGWMPAHPTFMAKRSLYQQYGGFSLDYRIASDFEMVARLLYVAGATYAYLPEAVIRMRAGGLSTSGFRNSWRLNNEIVRACKANGLRTNLFRVLLKTPEKLMERVWRVKKPLFHR